jgi:Caspase domain
MNKRLTALVIGNGGYVDVNPLKNPTNDADDIGEILAKRDFTIIKKTDCTHKEMDLALKEFRAALKDSDVGLFFFAGHGMQIDGENYLAAIDADADTETDAKHSSLSLNRVIETMEKSGTATNIIVLDACRENPFERAWHRSASSRGLAPVYAPKGTIIAYATSPGQIASDGAGRNGAYTAALLKHIDTPDVSLENMFKRVRNTLSAATNGKQISWEHTSLAGDFFFNLSLGARIDEYSDTALSDRLFVLDESKASHRIIQGLKTHDWYRQNPALDKLTAEVANKAGRNSMFVIGRNIYQAACGGSRTANEFLNSFMSKTSGFDEDRRKALMDGILFEVFFDSSTQLRDQPKNRCLDQTFELQQYGELSGSFAFISECLLTHADRFHAIPGKNRTITVDVVTKKKSGNRQVVKEVRFNGANILWIDDDSIVSWLADGSGYRKMTVSDFEKRLSDEMVVPTHLFKVTYTFDEKTKPTLLFPDGGTVRKR